MRQCVPWMLRAAFAAQQMHCCTAILLYCCTAVLQLYLEVDKLLEKEGRGMPAGACFVPNKAQRCCSCTRSRAHVNGLLTVLVQARNNVP